jgi:hypothetical protein
VNAEEVRQLADEIVSRPEFATPQPTLIERAINEVEKQIGKLLNAVADGGAGSVVGLVLLAGVIGVIVWLSIRYGRTVEVDRRLAGVTVEGVSRRSPAEWRAEAEEHEAAGDWKEALRCRYRALVGDLVAEGLLDDTAGRTTGELAAELRARAPVRATDFDAATQLFELAFYADRVTGPQESARFQELALAVTGVRA